MSNCPSQLGLSIVYRKVFYWYAMCNMMLYEPLHYSRHVVQAQGDSENRSPAKFCTIEEELELTYREARQEIFVCYIVLNSGARLFVTKIAPFNTQQVRQSPLAACWNCASSALSVIVESVSARHRQCD